MFQFLDKLFRKTTIEEPNYDTFVELERSKYLEGAIERFNAYVVERGKLKAYIKSNPVPYTAFDPALVNAIITVNTESFHARDVVSLSSRLYEPDNLSFMYYDFIEFRDMAHVQQALESYALNISGAICFTLVNGEKHTLYVKAEEMESALVFFKNLVFSHKA